MAWALVGGLIFFLWVLPRSVAAQAVWEFTPYRVRLMVAAERSPELAPEFERLLATGVARRISSLMGAFWDVELGEPADAFRRAMLANPEELTSQQVIEADKETLQFDKVMVVVVRPVTAGYQLVARELDVRTRIFSAPVRVTVWHAGKLHDAAVDAVLAAFAPLAEILPVEEDQVRLRLRAAGLAPQDPALAPVHPGDVFRPMVRRTDREGKLRGVFIVPWTFLVVRKLTGSIAECELHSGLRSPLSGRRRGRTENLALAVIPPQGTTQLVLRSRTEPYQPLAGYDVYAQPPDKKGSEWLGRTDSRGRVVVPPGEHLLRRVVVKHGGEILALLPIVPGLTWEPMLGFGPYNGQWPSEVPPSYLAGLLEPRDAVDETWREKIQQWLDSHANGNHGKESPAAEDQITLPFGRYEGRPLSAVPRPYLQGLVEERVRLDSQARAALSYAVQRSLHQGRDPAPVILEARVPDDDPRLKAEGYLASIQGELIDVVIRREILLARARARIEEKKYDEAQQLVDQLRTLKTREQFRRQLEQQHKKIATNDPVLQQKIDRMFREMEKVLLHYLDPKPIDALGRQLVQLRSGS